MSNIEYLTQLKKEIEKEDLTKDNVSKICQKYDEYYFQTYDEKWTLGRLKDKLKESTSLPSDATDLIKEINDYRILIVHKIFQNNLNRLDHTNKFLFQLMDHLYNVYYKLSIL